MNIEGANKAEEDPNVDTEGTEAAGGPFYRPALKTKFTDEAIPNAEAESVAEEETHKEYAEGNIIIVIDVADEPSKMFENIHGRSIGSGQDLFVGVIKGENSSSKISTETSYKSKCKKVLGEGNEDLVEGNISSKKKTSAQRSNEVLGKGIKRKSEEIEGGETPSKPVKLKEEAFNKVSLEVEATKKEALLSMRIKVCTFKEEAFDKVPL